ncbi:nucleotidyltransferase domain-containing protein [Candidatus Woesearchaeota archaeon]|nr:nucleotidyltransferase domain-containing protein [Candidatus Woesearchaeota archaeon]
MDMYKQKFTKLQNEIFRLFCIKAGISLNQRGIARMLKVSPTAVAKSLPLLEKEGLVNVQKSKGMNLISVSFNRDNIKAMELKRAENLKLVYESFLLEFLEEKFPGCAIILFGSYSRGEDTVKSDIDLAIIGSKEKEVSLTKFDKMLERIVFLHFYLSLKDIKKELRENLLNGIVLAGGIEL